MKPRWGFHLADVQQSCGLSSPSFITGCSWEERKFLVYKLSWQQFFEGLFFIRTPSSRCHLLVSHQSPQPWPWLQLPVQGRSARSAKYFHFWFLGPQLLVGQMRILHLRGFIKSQFEKKIVIICYNLVRVWKYFFFPQRESIWSFCEWERLCLFSVERDFWTFLFPKEPLFPHLTPQSPFLWISFLWRPWLVQFCVWLSREGRFLLSWCFRIKAASWR